MKNLLFLIILFFTLASFSQNHIISEYEKYDYEKKGQNYNNVLKLDDKNSLVLKLNNKFIIYKDESEISTISIGYLSSNIFYTKKIKEHQLINYKNILDTIKNINPSLLNETKNIDGEMVIEDGINYNLELYKNNYIVNYNTYSPEAYIEYKFPFYKERIRFMKVLEVVNNLFYDDEYEKIRNRDTIYLNISSKDYLTLEKLKIKKHSDKFKDLYIFTSLNNHKISVDKKDKNKKDVKFNKKEFLEKNKKSIIQLDFIDKYGLEIFQDKKKSIYIIDEKKLNIKKIQLIKFW